MVRLFFISPISPVSVLYRMQQTRHPIFQHMATALSHQQEHAPDLALAYWETLLNILPDEYRIHNDILAECAAIAHDAEHSRLKKKVEKLEQTYHAHVVSDKETQAYQHIYLAMTQQCGRNYQLACMYWQHAVKRLTSQSLVITLAVQDLCWNAQQVLDAGNIKGSLEIYQQIMRTFPDFLEGFINASLIMYTTGQPERAGRILLQLPAHMQREFIINRYLDLYQRMNELTEQFGHVPYAAIEDIVTDLQVENTFYPSLADTAFTTMIEDVVLREKGLYEKRRKALEERAIAKTSKRLSQEGLALGQRVTLAKHAGSDEVQNFLYDNEIRIAEVLLDNRNITREDVLVMAQTTHVSDILNAIATHFRWKTFRNITMAVLLNPQMLPQDAIPLLPRLSINDLAAIFYKRNIPTQIRVRARQRIQEIFSQLSLYDKVAIIEASQGDIFKLLDQIDINIPTFLDQLIAKFEQQPEIIVNVCRWKFTPSPILAAIAKNRQFRANAQVAFALLSNPRTPMGIVIARLQSLEQRDLRYLLTNTYLPTSVKQSIQSLFPGMSG